MERELAPSAAASFRAGTLGALRRCAATLNASTAPSSSSSGALPDLLSRCKHASQALALRYLYLRCLLLLPHRICHRNNA